jgi:hypothetical protein
MAQLCIVREGLLYERVKLVMQRGLLSGWHGWLFHKRLVHQFRQNKRNLSRHTADTCSLCEMDSLDPQSDKVEKELILKFAREQADSLYGTIAGDFERETVTRALLKFFEYEGR